MTIRLYLLAFFSLLCHAVYAETEIGFREDFALAPDRADILSTLVPGTEEYYYYTCLHALNTEAWDTFRDTYERWERRFAQSNRRDELFTRYMLLRYTKAPEETRDFLRNTLGLSFTHTPRRRDAVTYPTQLDPARIENDRYVRDALRSHSLLNGFTDAGLALVPSHVLNDAARRRAFLRRLRVPNTPDIVTYIVADLNENDSQGFGSLPIHTQLTRAQLDALSDALPRVGDDRRFVDAYCRRLAPSDAEDATQLAVRYAHLTRLWTYLSQRSAAFTDMKVHVLYHLLEAARAQGEYPRDLFEAYIALPRTVSYASERFAQQRRNINVARLTEDFSSVTSFPPVRDDTALVRAYLAHYFVDGDTYDAFTSLIDKQWLTRLYAETMLLNGIGDPAEWYKYLTPGQLHALRERVDIQFAAENPAYFAPDADVSLDVDIKNIDTLLIHIYRINAYNYYRDTGEEITTAIDLDGLVATYERTETYTDAPIRRVRRTFAFPELSRPGIYVIEFIGNGVSSRALVQKGHRALTVRPGPAGMEAHVWDESGALSHTASVWMGGRTYIPEPDGAVLIPYSTEPGAVTLIVRYGDVVTRHSVPHMPEVYTLDAGMYLDAESFVPGERAYLVVRPILKVNDQPIAPSLLEDVKMTLDIAGSDGVTYTLADVTLRLTDRGEGRVAFTVPPDLQEYTLLCTLRGKIQNISKGEKEALGVMQRFTLNTSAANESIYQTFLWRDGAGDYFIDVRGKDGMSRAEVPVSLSLEHAFFTERVSLTLQTDEAGTVRLGALPHITRVTAHVPNTPSVTWDMHKAWAAYPSAFTVEADTPFSLPLPPERAPDMSTSYALYEMRGGTPVADMTHTLSVHSTHLQIDNGLPEGNYTLHIAQPPVTLNVYSVAGTSAAQYISSPTRIVSAPIDELPYITAVNTTGDVFMIQLSTTSRAVRVHVTARSYLPTLDLRTLWGDAQMPSPRAIPLTHPSSLYVAERQLGDEHRYILDRAHARIFPGLMLERPGLLLNPWAVTETETGREKLQEGTAYARARTAEPPRTPAESPAWRRYPHFPSSAPLFAFLHSPARIAVNLRPDENGVISFSREAIGAYRLLDCVIVSPTYTAYRSIALEGPPPLTRDIRQRETVSPQETYIPQRTVHVLSTGGSVRVSAAHGAQHMTYATVDDLFHYYLAVSDEPTLEEFRFITTWHTLTQNQKRELYGRYACHELTLFLYHKDEAFFREIIRPYILQTMAQDFMTAWLCDDELFAYLSPARFAQLTPMEKALLARRLPAHQQAIARTLADAADVQPIPPETYARLFDTAVRGRMRSVPAAIVDMPLVAAPGLTYAARPESMMRLQEESAFADMDGLYDDRALGLVASDRHERRAEMALLYRAPETTKEWVESYYYRLPHTKADPHRIPMHPFWHELAHHPHDQPFLPESLLYAGGSFTEIMAALAVVDLPFEADVKEEIATDSDALLVADTVTISADTPVMIFAKDIASVPPPLEPAPLMMQKQVMRNDDRYIYVQGEKHENIVTNEYLVDVPYVASLVIGNPSAHERTVQVLASIPDGAVPLKNGFYRDALSLRLEPYSTSRREFYFYFPTVGSATQLPAVASIDMTAAARATYPVLPVVETPTHVDTGSWHYIAQYGSDDEVIAFLRTHNLYRISLTDIAFRMRDKAFYNRVCEVLEQRHVFDPTLWSYSIYHDDPARMPAYLAQSPIAARVGPIIQTDILTIDPFLARAYEHKEYAPLIHARTHQIGSRPRILNAQLRTQYLQLLDILCLMPELNNEARMAVTYYLLAQGRVAEAHDYFSRIMPDMLVVRTQYDYFAACFALYMQDLERAAFIAEMYHAHPIPRWRALFNEMDRHIRAARGTALDDDTIDLEYDSHTRQMERRAASAPTVRIAYEGTNVTITARNTPAVTLNIYPMDIELLFSRTPFAVHDSERFSYIAPAYTQTYVLEETEETRQIILPTAYHARNVVLEAVANGASDTAVYYAHALDVQIYETAGQLQVRHADTGAPVPATYVKVYGRAADDTVFFYKDGYTDMRGRFDYVSLTHPPEAPPTRLALLVLSDEYGAVTYDVAPPTR